MKLVSNFEQSKSPELVQESLPKSFRLFDGNPLSVAILEAKKNVNGIGGFHEVDYKWGQNNAAMKRSAAGLAARNTPFRFCVLLNNRFHMPTQTGVVDDIIEQEWGAPDPDKINVVYLNNFSTNHLHFTSWILLHRSFHCFQIYSGIKMDQARALWTGTEEALADFDVKIPRKGNLDFHTLCDSRNADLIRFMLTTRAGREDLITTELDVPAELWAQHHWSGVKLLRAEHWAERKAFANERDELFHGYKSFRKESVPDIRHRKWHDTTYKFVDKMLEQYSIDELNAKIEALENAITKACVELTNIARGKYIRF